MAVDLGNIVSKPTILLLNYPSFSKSRRTSVGFSGDFCSYSSHFCSYPSPSSAPSHYCRLPAAIDIISCKNGNKNSNFLFAKSPLISSRRNKFSAVPRSTGSDNNSDDTVVQEKEKVPFGYSRKDVLLIGLGVTLFGIGLKSGLEYGGVDPLQAGNVVQLVLVLGLTVGWISTYMFRVSNKDMTYAQQLRDYEKKVMEKRLEGLTEAEVEALLEQVEEEKRRIPSGEQV